MGRFTSYIPSLPLQQLVCCPFNQVVAPFSDVSQSVDPGEPLGRGSWRANDPPGGRSVNVTPINGPLFHGP